MTHWRYGYAFSYPWSCDTAFFYLPVRKPISGRPILIEIMDRAVTPCPDPIEQWQSCAAASQRICGVSVSRMEVGFRRGTDKLLRTCSGTRASVQGSVRSVAFRHARPLLPDIGAITAK